MTELTYQVDSNGQVISVKAYKDTPAYSLTVGQPVDSLPIPRYGFRTDRWQSLKRQICHLPILPNGKWHPIPGWPNKLELKRARNVLSKKEDNFMNGILNGNTLEVATDSENLIMYVRVVEKV